MGTTNTVTVITEMALDNHTIVVH